MASRFRCRKIMVASLAAVFCLTVFAGAASQGASCGHMAEREGQPLQNNEGNALFNVKNPVQPAAAPSITLYTPAPGDIWTVGTTQNITWFATGGTGTLFVTLDYSPAGTGGPWNTIATNIMNSGSYSWLVMNTPSTDCYMRASVVDSGTPTQNAMDMKGSFTIKSYIPPPVITVRSPNGGEVWDVGSVHTISWNASSGTGALTVDIYYTIDGPAGTPIPIALDEPNDGKFTWTIPDKPSDACYVNITVTDSGTPSQSSWDMSNASFSINPIVIGTVSGYVRDDNDTAVVNATLTVYQRSTVTTALTNSKGKYTITLGVGDYKLKANKTGYITCTPDEASVTIKASETTFQDFKLSTKNPNEKPSGPKKADPGIYFAAAGAGMLVIFLLFFAFAMKKPKKAAPQQQYDASAQYPPQPEQAPAYPPQPGAPYPASGSQYYPAPGSQGYPPQYPQAPPGVPPPAASAPYPAQASAGVPPAAPWATEYKLCPKCRKANEKWKTTCSSCNSPIP